jgi:Na+/glutamate symporter
MDLILIAAFVGLVAGVAVGCVIADWTLKPRPSTPTPPPSDPRLSYAESYLKGAVRHPPARRPE